MTSSPPPTPATQSGSATSPSAGTSSATCGRRRATSGALEAFTEARTSPKRAGADPGNAGWQRDLSVSWDRLGEVRQSQGDLAGALAAYEASHAIAELGAVGPGQRQLAARPVGELEQARRRASGPGRPQGALEAYTAARTSATARRRRPRQRGVAARPLGQLEQARRRSEHKATLRGRSRPTAKANDIIAKLAAADPGNAGWQRDLSVSWDKLGDVRVAQGDLAGALQAFTAGRTSPTSSPPPTPATPGGSAISASATSARRRAGGTGRPARLPGLPTQARHHRQARRRRPRQRPVAARPVGQLGEARRRAAGPGRPQGRARGLTRSMDIRKLAAVDPGNAEWQRDLDRAWAGSPKQQRQARSPTRRDPLGGACRRPSPGGLRPPRPGQRLDRRGLEQRLAATPTAPARHPDPARHRPPVMMAGLSPPALSPPIPTARHTTPRPRSARAPGSARPLVHHPHDNPKIANARLTPHLTGPALPMIIAG